MARRNERRGTGLRLKALFMIFLFVLLPAAAALEISGTTADPVTSSSASIRWKTDEPADSFVQYGVEGSPLTTVGDAKLVTDHVVQISGLTPETKYVYSVESNDVADTNGGNLYSFTTPPPDTTAPEIKVEFPKKIAGTRWSFSGETEVGATVSVTVNGKASGTATTQPLNGDTSKGVFSFTDLLLAENAENAVVIDVVDAAGNKGTATGTIFTDAKKPTVDVKRIPSFVADNSYELSLPVSEPVTYEILVNNKSASKGEGTIVTASLHLQEGKNTVLLKLTDEAGWTTEEQFVIDASGKPPTIKAEIERGKEFYEGRAFSPISGTTSPGAKVYLYVYKPLPTEFTPQFDRPRSTTTADENGVFRFDDVSFVSSIADISLEKLVPKQIPSDLVKIKIYPLAEGAQQQTFYVYLIAEDRAGRTVSWQQQVMINSCFSTNLDFSIETMPEFLAPLRLVPQLVDQGRQNVQAVFKLHYNGLGVPLKTADGKVIEQGVRVTNIVIDKACTQGMAKDEKFGLGCKLLPNRPQRVLPNADQSAVYASWTLRPGEELSEADESFWDELKDRQVVFPLKIQVTYQDIEKREGVIGSPVYGQSKVQSVCTDLSYFVDIPIDSKDMIPDFLAEEGVDALNWTITQINTVTPYIEQAYIVTAITGMAAFMLRTVGRWVRIFTSFVEKTFSKVSELKCEDPENYYLEDTLRSWRDKVITNLPPLAKSAIDSTEGSEAWNQASLEKRCPSTATAWKFEALMDQAYKWSWDRAFCRAVPARWTEDKKDEDIRGVILSQQQCAVSGQGETLTKRENCYNDLLKPNNIHINVQSISYGLKDSDITICWLDKDSNIYLEKPRTLLELREKDDADNGFIRFQWVGNLYSVTSVPRGNDIVTYRPPNSENVLIGRDQTCAQACNARPGYHVDTEFGANGCYTQKSDGKLVGKNGQEKVEGRVQAGYTKDCFVEKDEKGLLKYGGDKKPILQQCVCAKDDLPANPPKDTVSGSMRVAKEPVEEGQLEEWFYQQAQLYSETGGTHGTFYHPDRYYAGRDFSGAFGANYLVDFILQQEKEAKVNPHTQIIGTFQTVCFSGVLKNLRLLQSMLAGVQSCLIEAKYTGLHDAGMCKTLFTQQVCGLIYQGIAALAGNSCTPNDFTSIGKEGAIADAGAVISGGFSSMTKALDTSFEDARKDYGNAALNQYFKGGTQGFAQSICLAAFGYDFPLFSEDFLLDAAYSFPTKTFPVVAPATRELSAYDPTKQMAIFNYNIGGVIFPGCKVKTWSLKLKCIGQGDRNNPNVDLTCGGKGCDCLSTSNTGGAFEAQKEQQLASGFNLPPAQMFSIPLESPQQVTAPYRYDHVVVDLVFDPSEKDNYNKCVDAEFLQGNRATYYFPINDVSPPSALSCSVDATSGRYQCPELYSLFGYGGAFLEDPYVTCWNKKTESWMSCDTPNLFVLNDEIKVRAHVNSDGKGQCLKRTVTQSIPGISSELIRPVVQNVQGAQYVPEVLGIVGEGMFGGSAPIFKLIPGESNPGCQEAKSTAPLSLSTGEKYTFAFDAGSTAGTVKLIVPSNVNILTEGYARSGLYLAKNNVVDLPIPEINTVQFSGSGFTFSNVLGNINPVDANRRCVFQAIEENRYVADQNARGFTVTYQLLEKNEAGGCELAHIPVKTSLGKPSASQKITIQKAETAISGMHKSFMAGNYQQTLEQAGRILNQRQGDMENVLAYYYYIASVVMLSRSNPVQYEPEIRRSLGDFFHRKWYEQDAEQYAPHIQNSGEYQKIKKYLCEADGRYGGVNAASCSSGEVLSSGGGQSAMAGDEACRSQGYDINIGEQWLYKCLDENKASSCRRSDGQVEKASFEIPDGPLKVACNTPALN